MIFKKNGFKTRVKPLRAVDETRRGKSGKNPNKWFSAYPPRPKMVAKLDKLTSLIVRKPNSFCVTCGPNKNRGQALTNGHLLSRVRLSTRFDIEPDGNCHPQCWPCNVAHEANPAPYREWYIAMFGLVKYEVLELRWNSSAKISDPELADKIESYRRILYGRTHGTMERLGL